MSSTSAHAWDKRNPEKKRAIDRAWRERNPGKNRASARDSRMGKGAHAHLQAQVKAQGNRCAICFKPLVESKNTHLDHDHETQQFRGALCSQCNCGLGYFFEDTGNLRNAITYLRKWRT